MFILLWMYLGGIICALTASVELVIANHYRFLKMLLMIVLSIVWPITYLANLIFIAIDTIQRNKT